MTTILPNNILAFTYPTERKGDSCPLLWDLRDPPSSAAQLVSYPRKHRSTTDFKFLQSQHATTPPITALRILCDLLPYRRWKITARNDQGVTVGDVLAAIHQVARMPLTITEWERLPSKHQERIKRVFDVRWRGAVIREQERKEIGRAHF